MLVTEAKGTCVGAGSPCYGGSARGVAPNVGLYPRMHLMPNGLVVTCGIDANVRSWDPENGKWSLLGLTSSDRHYGASFLLPLHNITSKRGKILLVGGSPEIPGRANSGKFLLDTNAVLDFSYLVNG